MTEQTTPLIFDGHNDALLKLWRNGGLAQAAQFTNGYDAAVDAPKARAGGFGGGFFAVYVPSANALDTAKEEMKKPVYDLPLPDPLAFESAIGIVMAEAAILFDLERQGALTICRTAADIRATMAAGRIAAIFHIEGADGIDPDMHTLDVLHAAGLRSLGPVWSRPTIWGEGVPFRFPSDGDIGGGLTGAGVALVKRCNALRIMIDLSHLNEAGFWDVAKHSDAPLVATHSNVHTICPHSRNLTDRQLDAIRDSDGMVGLNFGVAFLREDGRIQSDTPLDQMMRHLDYLIERVGETRVGFGSDYDGTTVPDGLETVADLPKLRAAMAKHGYDAPLIARLCNENWLRVLEKTWGA